MKNSISYIETDIIQSNFLENICLDIYDSSELRNFITDFLQRTKYAK